MRKRLSPVALMGAVRAVVEGGTGLPCVSDPDGRAAPFYGIELRGTRPGASKGLRLEEYELLLHTFAPPAPSQVEALELATRLEEALEVRAALPAPYTVVSQEEAGIQQVKRDESGEWHVVTAYRVVVSYGIICK